jgi:hypothetical protein
MAQPITLYARSSLAEARDQTLLTDDVRDVVAATTVTSPTLLAAV